MMIPHVRETFLTAKCLPVLLESRDGCICGGLIFKTPNGDPFPDKTEGREDAVFETGAPQGYQEGMIVVDEGALLGGVLGWGTGVLIKKEAKNVFLSLFFFLI